MFLDRRFTLSVIALAFVLSFTVSPVMADIQPLTNNEMSDVSGKSHMQQIVAQAQSMDKLDPVFEEVKTLSSSERLREETVFGGAVNNPLTQDLTGQIAQQAVQNPVTATRIATSGTVQEMAKIAATTASIFKGFVGNIPSGQ